MSERHHDPLTNADPDRVSYATGTLLEANDFTAEQTYHRGRLAAALINIAGSGTIAGLDVVWTSADEATSETEGAEEELRVHPGVAIDPSGRIIEVPRAACIRLSRWFDEQVALHPDDVTQGYHGAPHNGVIVDLFIRFIACPRGKTPAFASGPYDALDAIAPSRLRDSYELKLVIRTDQITPGDPKLPASNWPSQNADLTTLQQAILQSYESRATLQDHVPSTEDVNSVFLARLVIPATQAVPNTETTLGSIPIRTADDVTVDKFSRRFVYSTAALAGWLL